MRIAIIGAGPAGLYFAGLCQNNNIEYEIFEASNCIGGQLTKIYPEKEIVNIPNISSILAKDYIKNLSYFISTNNIHLNTKITDLTDLKTKYDYIIIATGLGELSPIKLNLENVDKYNVIYYLHEPSKLRDKKVIIFGGGNAALDWAKQLSEISAVSLVHRCSEFRGNANTINNLSIPIYLCYIPVNINSKFITIKSTVDNHQIDLPYDYIFVNFGNSFVKQEFLLNSKVLAIGDYLSGPKTIANCISSAEFIFKIIMEDSDVSKH